MWVLSGPVRCLSGSKPLGHQVHYEPQNMQHAANRADALTKAVKKADAGLVAEEGKKLGQDMNRFGDAEVDFFAEGQTMVRAGVDPHDAFADLSASSPDVTSLLTTKDKTKRRRPPTARKTKRKRHQKRRPSQREEIQIGVLERNSFWQRSERCRAWSRPMTRSFAWRTQSCSKATRHRVFIACRSFDLSVFGSY